MLAQSACRRGVEVETMLSFTIAAALANDIVDMLRMTLFFRTYYLRDKSFPHQYPSVPCNAHESGGSVGEDLFSLPHFVRIRFEAYGHANECSLRGTVLRNPYRYESIRKRIPVCLVKVLFDRLRAYRIWYAKRVKVT